MEQQNIELVNQVLNEAGQFIIGTVGQYSLDWDYACFVNAKSNMHSKGEFYLFHKSQPVSFKSSELVLVLYRLIEDYKKALNLNADIANVSIKYVIRNSDLKPDLQIDRTSSEVWSSDLSQKSSNLFNILIKNTYQSS